jgi:integrase/recombinase XerC
MIRRRAAAAGIETKLGNHSFRATGITAYLKNDSSRYTEASVIGLSPTSWRKYPTNRIEFGKFGLLM